MKNKLTLPFTVAMTSLVAATIFQIQKDFPYATYMLGLAIFNMVVHIGIRQEEK